MPNARRRTASRLASALIFSLLTACQAPGGDNTGGRVDPEASAPAPTALVTAEALAPDVPTNTADESTRKAFPTAAPNPLSKGPLAPELDSDTWLNSEPIRMASLRGDVVVVDFWTYG